MAQLEVLAGATSVSTLIFIQNSSSTTGAGLTGVAPAGGALLASFTAYYSFAGANAGSVAISLSVLATVGAAWTSGGIVEIDATHMPGWYRFDIPNLVLAAAKGRIVGINFSGGTNVAPCPLAIELTGWDNQNATNGGLANLDAAISSRMPTFTLPTNFSSLAIDASGRIDVGKWLGNAVTAATAGVPDVNAARINSVSTASVTTINPNLGTTQPMNFTGTGASALVKSDTVDIAGAAVSTSTAQIGVNVVNFGGSAGTFSAGKPAVTLNATDVTGNLPAALKAIVGTTLTETSAGYLATAFQTQYNVASPVFTAASVNQTGDSFARIGASGAGLTAVQLAPASITPNTYTTAAWQVITNRVDVTGTTTPATADTYIPFDFLNGRRYYKSTTLGTAMYLWSDGGTTWTLSTAVGVNGTAYFTRTGNTLPTGNYTPQGTATGGPVVNEHGGELLSPNQYAVTFNAVTVTGATSLQDGLTVARSTLNGDAVTITGNGFGKGLVVNSGANGTVAFQVTASGTNADAIKLTPNGGLGINGTLGTVNSVTNGVTVTTNNDKGGYSLAASQSFNNTGQTTNVPADAKAINGVATTAVTAVGANVGTAQPLNFTGAGASALVQADTRDFLGHAVVLDANNLPQVDAADWNGTAITSGVPNTASVTVTTNNDKTGYKLAPDGVDLIIVETGVNLRQAQSPILAAAGGVLSGAGAGGGTIKIYAGANPGTQRIQATTDGSGNRSVVTLFLPA